MDAVPGKVSTAKLSPIPVLAETLGYSQATLERHATAEATTYGRYIATRR